MTPNPTPETTDTEQQLKALRQDFGRMWIVCAALTFSMFMLGICATLLVSSHQCKPTTSLIDGA